MAQIFRCVTLDMVASLASTYISRVLYQVNLQKDQIEADPTCLRTFFVFSRCQKDRRLAMVMLGAGHEHRPRGDDKLQQA